ncbi:MAG: hypothetical protein JWP81_4256 [Ferruginibacter sp.]|nr:hypothetical protein [Ferruginibacter sp.]
MDFIIHERLKYYRWLTRSESFGFVNTLPLLQMRMIHEQCRLKILLNGKQLKGIIHYASYIATSYDSSH